MSTAMFNFNALAITPLNYEPFDHIVVPHFIEDAALQAINRDYPEIETPRNFDPAKLTFGPGFRALLDKLNSSAFSRCIGEKFGVDLEGMPSTITVRRFCESSDGNIHTDHWSKVVTVLLYFNPEWTHEGGQLRLLRAKKDIEDFAEEVPPLAGTLLAFRCGGRSFHGHKTFVGERRMVQMNWIRSSKMARSVQKLARFSTHSMKRLIQIGR